MAGGLLQKLRLVESNPNRKKLSHFRLQPDRNVFTPLNTAADFLLRLGLPMLLLVDVESLDLTPTRFLLKIEKDVPPIAIDFLKKSNLGTNDF